MGLRQFGFFAVSDLSVLGYRLIRQVMSDGPNFTSVWLPSSAVSQGPQVVLDTATRVRARVRQQKRL